MTFAERPMIHYAVGQVRDSIVAQGLSILLWSPEDEGMCWVALLSNITQ